jgi:hypothetical protein
MDNLITNFSTFGLLGVIILLSGLFLVLSGTGVLKVEKVSVVTGVKTWVLGIICTVIGASFLYFDTKESSASITPNIGTTTPIITFVQTSPAVEVRATPQMRFHLRNKWNPYCLAVKDDSQALDNQVVMAECDSLTAIWWWNGQEIRNNWNSYCLASFGESKEIDNPVVMGACDQANAIWRWNGAEIRNNWNPYCLGSIGDSQEIDNPVVMGACDIPNGEWYIEPIR